MRAEIALMPSAQSPGDRDAIELRAGGWVRARSRARDRRDPGRRVDDILERGPVDACERLAASRADQVGAAQPVEEAGGEGIAGAHGVDEVDRDRRPLQL